jgi:hypothetical protein
MSSDIWLCLSSSERALLREALSAHRSTNKTLIESLLRKVERAGSLPETTLRVEDSFVEVEGNPNPIRIYDYDCDGVEDESLSPDEEGRACIVSEYEPSASH